jgi:hypothetical protein
VGKVPAVKLRILLDIVEVDHVLLDDAQSAVNFLLFVGFADLFLGDFDPFQGIDQNILRGQHFIVDVLFKMVLYLFDHIINGLSREL